MIEKLTKEQEEYLPVFRREMLDMGLDCGETNKEEVEEVIESFYKSINKKKPIVLYFDSPLSCNIIINLIEKGLFKNLGDNLRDNLWDNLGANLWDNLWDNLRANLRDNLRDNLRANLRDNLEYVYTQHCGQQDIYWIAFYKFCENIGIEYKQEESKLLDKWFTLSKNIMWWYPYENYCIISKKPKKINWDYTNGYMHSYTEKSIEFNDGYGLYTINGLTVDSRLVEKPETVLVKEIEDEENIELRRIKIQIYENAHGVGSYIKESGAKIIDKNELGELYKKEIKDDESIVMVKVLNSTQRKDGTKHEYFLRVPPTIKRVTEAIAWTFGMEAKHYSPIVET